MTRAHCLFFLLDIVVSTDFLLASTTASTQRGPLCFSCSNFQNPFACHTLAHCHGDEKCFTTYRFLGDPHDALLWEAGCRKALDCSTVKTARRDTSSLIASTRMDPININPNVYPQLEESGHGETRAYRDAVESFAVCDECCDGNYCNELPCGHQSTPSTVSTGLLCHACQGLDDASKCTRVTRCQVDEVCGAWISVDGLLNLGCRRLDECGAVAGNGGWHLGKRNAGDVSSSRPKDGDLLEDGQANDGGSDGEIFLPSSEFTDISEMGEQDDNASLALRSSPLHASYGSTLRGATCSQCCNASFCAFDVCTNFIVTPISVALTPSNITLVQGQNVSFVCSVTGKLPMNVTFFLLSRTTNSSHELKACRKSLLSIAQNVTCTLPVVSPSTSGSLECRATDGRRPFVESATALIDVEERIQPLHVVTRPQDAVVGGSSPIRVSCAVDGLPVPSYTWFRNDSSGSLIDLRGLNSFSIVDGGNGSSVLEVDPRWRGDDNFLCQANNQHESLTLTFSLRSATNVTLVHIPAHLVVDPTSISINVTTYCSFQSFPVATVRWLLFSSANQSQGLDQYADVTVTSTTSKFKVTSSTIHIPIDLLLRENSTRIQCQMDNGFFSRHASANIDFLEPPTITTPPETFDLALGSDLTLKCSAKGNPKPAIHWYFLDESSNPTLVAGASILDSGHTLQMPDLRVRGTVTCMASNSMGRDQVSFKVNLT